MTEFQNFRVQTYPCKNLEIRLPGRIYRCCELKVVLLALSCLAKIRNLENFKGARKKATQTA